MLHGLPFSIFFLVSSSCLSANNAFLRPLSKIRRSSIVSHVRPTSSGALRCTTSDSNGAGECDDSSDHSHPLPPKVRVSPSRFWLCFILFFNRRQLINFQSLFFRVSFDFSLAPHYSFSNLHQGERRRPSRRNRKRRMLNEFVPPPRSTGDSSTSNAATDNWEILRPMLTDRISKLSSLEKHRQVEVSLEREGGHRQLSGLDATGVPPPGFECKATWTSCLLDGAAICPTTFCSVEDVDKVVYKLNRMLPGYIRVLSAQLKDSSVELSKAGGSSYDVHVKVNSCRNERRGGLLDRDAPFVARWASASKWLEEDSSSEEEGDDVDCAALLVALADESGDRVSFPPCSTSFDMGGDLRSTANSSVLLDGGIFSFIVTVSAPLEAREEMQHEGDQREVPDLKLAIRRSVEKFVHNATGRRLSLLDDRGIILRRMGPEKKVL